MWNADLWQHDRIDARHDNLAQSVTSGIPRIYSVSLIRHLSSRRTITAHKHIAPGRGTGLPPGELRSDAKILQIVILQL